MKNKNLLSNQGIDAQIKLNTRKILRGQLTLENFADAKGTKFEIITQTMQKITEYRKLKPTLTNNQLLEVSNNICKALEETYTYLGRDNFTFFDDGDVLFNG